MAFLPLPSGTDRENVRNRGRNLNYPTNNFSLTPSNQTNEPEMRLSRGGLINPPNSLEGPYKLYNKAVEQQAGDYDSIMSGYKNLISGYQPGGQFDLSRNLNAPEQFNYSRSGKVGQALSNLSGLSQSGGYTSDELASLRARGVSPIRAAYANALREMKRRVALSGGRSANFNAASSRMAREQSEMMAEAMNNLNASLAERVAQNRIGIAPAFASAANQENALANEMRARSTEANNQFDRDRVMLKRELGSNIGDALRGMTSLYGTTPALSNLYGSQAGNAAQLQHQINQDASEEGARRLRLALSR